MSTTERCANAEYNAQRWKRRNFGARRTAEQLLKRVLSAIVTAEVVQPIASNLLIIILTKMSSRLKLILTLYLKLVGNNLTNSPLDVFL